VKQSSRKIHKKGLKS